MDYARQNFYSAIQMSANASAYHVVKSSNEEPSADGNNFEEGPLVPETTNQPSLELVRSEQGRLATQNP